jgi:hypothetical protein
MFRNALSVVEMRSMMASPDGQAAPYRHHVQQDGPRRLPEIRALACRPCRRARPAWPRRRARAARPKRRSPAPRHARSPPPPRQPARSGCPGGRGRHSSARSNGTDGRSPCPTPAASRSSPSSRRRRSRPPARRHGPRCPSPGRPRRVPGACAGTRGRRRSRPSARPWLGAAACRSWFSWPCGPRRRSSCRWRRR